VIPGCFLPTPKLRGRQFAPSLDGLRVSAVPSLDGSPFLISKSCSLHDAEYISICSDTDVSNFGVGLPYHISSKMVSVLPIWNVLTNTNMLVIQSFCAIFLRIPERFGGCVERNVTPLSRHYSVSRNYVHGNTGTRRLNWNVFWEMEYRV